MDSSMERVILEADPSLTKHLVKRALESTLCPICQDHMFVPFMTKCGHNYCYECLTSWIETNQTCPSCRAEIVEEPYLNVHIQDMVNTLIETAKKISLLPKDVLRDRDMKVKYYKKDVNSNNLFKRVFQNTGYAIVDNLDGVARCSNCHWEVEGNRCPNCNIHLRNTHIDEISSPNTDLEIDEFENRRSLYSGGWFTASEEERSADEEPDEDDDSFIDDGDLGELERGEDHGGHASSENSRDSSPVRQLGRRYVPTFLDEEDSSWEDQSDEELRTELYAESWNGFNDRRHSNHLNDMEAVDQEIDDHLDVIHYCESDEDEDPVDSFSPRRRTRTIGVIHDSDVEDEDNDE